MRKMIDKKKGYTLVEVIIALAMIGILAISFLSIFTSGFRTIAKTGHRAVAAYGSQQQLSEKVINASALDSDEYSEQKLTFTFKSGPVIEVDVRVIETEVEVNGNKSKMNGFVIAP